MIEATETQPSILNNEDNEPTKLEVWLERHKEDAKLCEAINAAVKQYGEDEVEVLCMSKPKGAVAVFRAPTAAEYHRFMGGILHESVETKAKAAGLMARSCILYPSKLLFGSWCDRYGGIGNAVLKPLSKLAGAELADRGKE